MLYTNKKHYIVFGLFAPLAISACTEREVEKPNILFLFADDWGRYASVYDAIDGGNTINALINTPNIDRLAEGGVTFTDAHVPAPSCTPCRSSLLSGQYFFKTGMGAILHGAEWDMSIPTYPLLLEENGYHIGFTYKVWSPGEPRDAPYGGEEKRYEVAGRRFNNFSQNVSNQNDILVGKQALYDEVRGNFTSFLDANTNGQPFCYWFGPTNTHRAWTQGSGKDLWGLDPDLLKGKLPSFLPDVPEIREDFNDYLGEVLAFDAAVGVILEVLEQRGLKDNTVIVVSGDHGIPGFPRAKTNLYYFGSETVLVVNWPKHFPGNRVVDDIINLMDLAPTFLELGGVDIPAVMDGKSMVPILKSKKEGLIDESNNYVLTGRERHVSTAREDGLPYPQRAIRTKEYLYIRNFKPDRWPIGTLNQGLRDIDGGPTTTWFIKNRNNQDYHREWDLAFGKRPNEELYFLPDDPYETTNLAADPNFSRTKEKLSDMLDSLMAITDDPRLNNENCVFDHDPYTRMSDAEIQRHNEYVERVLMLMSESE